MDANEIEDLTIKMEIVINTLTLIMEKLDYDLDENYTILLENNCREVHKDLRSYEFLLKRILESFISLRKKYQEQIELHYSNT